MENPKIRVYNLLTSIQGLTVYQFRPDVIAVIPSVTFFIEQNNPIYELDKLIGYQDVNAVIDIWAETSSQAGTLLTTIEEKLRGEGIRLVSSGDIPDPDGLSRITARFNLVI